MRPVARAAFALAALARHGQFRGSRILAGAGSDTLCLTSAGGTMTGMLTDLETLAEQMRLPAGGIAFVLWADQAPKLLVRARGGFTMDHIPLKAAFEQGLVECSANPATATTMAVARAPLPNQDVLIEDNRLRGVDAPAIESGSACTLLEVKAKIEGEWKVIGRRLLYASHEMTRRLVEHSRVQSQCEVNLLQGPRPQFVGKCAVALPPGILAGSDGAPQ